MASESRRAMIAITTSSSINVNPERGRTASPIPIGLAVDALSLREREDVEDIVAFTGIVGRARVAALSPGGRGGKRGIGVQGIARDAAQEVDLRLLRALLVVDALGEVLEFLGIARVADRLLDQRSEEHTSELQSRSDLVCRLLLEKKKQKSAKSACCGRGQRGGGASA